MRNLRIYSKNKYVKKKNVHKLVNALSEKLNFSILSLDINFISAKRIKKININYLNHPYSTDIITFNYSEQLNVFDAEIFISIDDAISNAAKFQVSIQTELARLIIHGILHLLGYDDQKINKKILMKRLENKLLNTFKFILL